MSLLTVRAQAESRRTGEVLVWSFIDKAVARGPHHVNYDENSLKNGDSPRRYVPMTK